MQTYKTAIVGLGQRGLIHLHGLTSNPDVFRIAGICDHHEEKLEKAANRYHIPKKMCYTDAAQMMEETRPDILVFVTMPKIRIPLVKLAVQYKVKGLMLEKPMAENLWEAHEIKQLCETNGIKAVICHQHKYLDSFLKLKEVIDSGVLGEILEIQAACQPHAAQLGTHYIDYMLWANGSIPANCVVGHVHGNFHMEDSHPSPDYVLGRIVFHNGVRGLLECGYLSKPQESKETGFLSDAGLDYWTDDRLTVYGSRGFAWAQCNGDYKSVVSQDGLGITEGKTACFETAQYDAQVRYTKEFGDWMRDDSKLHSSRMSVAYHGYEILEAFYQSALHHTRTDLPLSPEEFRKGGLHSVLKSVLNPVTYKRID